MAGLSYYRSPMTKTMNLLNTVTKETIITEKK